MAIARGETDGEFGFPQKHTLVCRQPLNGASDFPAIAWAAKMDPGLDARLAGASLLSRPETKQGVDGPVKATPDPACCSKRGVDHGVTVRAWYPRCETNGTASEPAPLTHLTLCVW